MINLNYTPTAPFRIRAYVKKGGMPCFCLSDVCHALQLESSEMAHRITRYLGRAAHTYEGIDALESQLVDGHAYLFITLPQVYFVLAHADGYNGRMFLTFLEGDCEGQLQWTNKEE